MLNIEIEMLMFIITHLTPAIPKYVLSIHATCISLLLGLSINRYDIL